MEESLERFRSQIESLDAIFLVNEERKIAHASASRSKTFGHAPEELVSRSGLALIHPEVRDHFDRTSREVLERAYFRRQADARIRGKDGSGLLDEAEVSAIVLNSREVNAKRAEEEGRRLHLEELTRSNLELQAFAHTVAHDLREPLRTISAFTELLVRTTPINEEGKETARFIVDGVKRMSVLLDSLLSSASYGSCNPLKRVELTHAAEQALQNLRQAITASGASITIERLPIVQGRESDLVRLFQNLLGNAMQYRSEAPVKIHISAEWAGPEWVIRIKDNGTGIPREHQNRIFGLFTRLHTQDIEGTGVGLALCKKIIEGLGGTIWVESSPGLGSTFCFSLTGTKEESQIRVICDDDRHAGAFTATSGSD